MRSLYCSGIRSSFKYSTCLMFGNSLRSPDMSSKVKFWGGHRVCKCLNFGITSCNLDIDIWVLLRAISEKGSPFNLQNIQVLQAIKRQEQVQTVISEKRASERYVCQELRWEALQMCCEDFVVNELGVLRLVNEFMQITAEMGMSKRADRNEAYGVSNKRSRLTFCMYHCPCSHWRFSKRR